MGQLFVNSTLPFGLRSVPRIFNAVAEALAYIIKLKGVKGLDHYLDVFSIVGDPKSPECSRYLTVALETCEQTGFAVKAEKKVCPATRITLLGIELDSKLLQLRLSQDKLVAKWRSRKACTKWNFNRWQAT